MISHYRAMIYASRMKERILYHICNANISYGFAVYHIAKGDISLKDELHYGTIQLDKLEFGGESPLTMRYGLRRSNEITSRPVTMIRSAYGIR